MTAVPGQPRAVRKELVREDRPLVRSVQHQERNLRHSTEVGGGTTARPLLAPQAQHQGLETRGSAVPQHGEICRAQGPREPAVLEAATGCQHLLYPDQAAGLGRWQT